MSNLTTSMPPNKVSKAQYHIFFVEMYSEPSITPDPGNQRSNFSSSLPTFIFDALVQKREMSSEQQGVYLRKPNIKNKCL